MNSKVIDYVKNSVAQGYAVDQIERAMLNAGYSQKEADEAVKAASARPKGSSKKIWILPVVAIVIIVGALFAIIFYTQSQTSYALEEETFGEEEPELYEEPPFEPRSFGEAASEFNETATEDFLDNESQFT